MSTRASSGELKPDGVFVNWMRYHGRSEGLARALGLREWYDDGGSGPALRRYLRLWARTREALSDPRPSAVVVLQPPVVSLMAVLWHTRGTGCRVAGDLHTGVFDDPKWTWATGLTLRLLRKRGLAIVTNEALATRVRARGGTAVVLHDLIEEYPDRSSEPFDDAGLHGLDARGFVLVPVTYSYDEPLRELRDAAASTPQLTWVFTGRAPEDFRAACPANVVFTGFVAHDDYLRLLARAAAVIAPTTSENTMQQAGYEALCAARPLVTSRTRVLVEYFGDHAAQVAPVAAEFADAVRDAVADPERHGSAMRDLRAAKIAEQDASLRTVREWLRRGTGFSAVQARG